VEAISEIIGEFGRDRRGPATGPFERLVGYRTRLSVAQGAYVELHVEERHLSQYGVVALVLLDTVGVHLLAARPELARLATISLSANFIGPVRPGRCSRPPKSSVSAARSVTRRWRRTPATSRANSWPRRMARIACSTLARGGRSV
jgi:acyl-coenzyme A thioesterase PaaI-like protein